MLFDFVNNLPHNGHKTVTVSLGKGAMFNDFAKSNIDFRFFERKWPIDPSVVIGLRKLIRSEKIEIINTHSDVVAVHAYLATRFLNTKMVLFFHGNTYSDKFNFKRNLSLKYLVPKMDACVAVSKSYLNVLRQRSLFPVHNFSVVYNGVDFKKFPACKGQLKAELNLPENTFLIGMIGNFNWGRDQLTVCKALPGVFKELPDARFVFVGARLQEYAEVYDECVSYCAEQKISDKVYFLGSRKDTPNILNSLNLYLYASKSDSFGISLIEAMYCGVPLLVNDLPVFLEITNNGEYATVFKSGDARDIVEKIMDLKNSGFGKCKAEKAKVYAEQKFSIHEHIKNLISLYQSL